MDFAELPRSLVVLKLKGNPILAPCDALFRGNRRQQDSVTNRPDGNAAPQASAPSVAIAQLNRENLKMS